MDTNIFGNPDAKGLCAICFDDLTGINVLCTSTCHHWFCLDCITRFLSNPAHPSDCVCPLCRTLFRWCRCGSHTLDPVRPARDAPRRRRNPNWAIFCHLAATNPRKGRFSRKEGRVMEYDDNWITPGCFGHDEDGDGDHVGASAVRYTNGEIDYKRLPTVVVSFGKFMACIALRPLDRLPAKLDGVISPWWKNTNVFSSVTVGGFIHHLHYQLLAECVIAENRTPGSKYIGIPGDIKLGGLVDFINAHLVEFFINFIHESDTDLPQLARGHTVTPDQLRAAHLKTPFYKIYFLMREFLRFGAHFISDKDNQEAPRFIEVVPFTGALQRALLNDPAPQMFLEALLQGLFVGTLREFSGQHVEELWLGWEMDIQDIGEERGWEGCREHWVVSTQADR